MNKIRETVKLLMLMLATESYIYTHLPECKYVNSWVNLVLRKVEMLGETGR